MGHSDAPHHGSQQQRLIPLVRPYVFGTGEPTGLPGEQAEDALADDTVPLGVPHESATPGRHGTTASAGHETTADAPAVDREPAGPPRRFGPARHNRPGTAVSLTWLLAMAGTIAAIAAFALLLLSHDAPRAASRCPTGKCQVAVGQASRTATAPTPIQEATTHPATGRSSTLPSSRPAAATMPASATAVATTPSATAPASLGASTPSSPTPPASTVSVSYTLIQQWDGGFEGEFTIVNKGSTAINGWQLSAVLPGDQTESAWDASFQTDGDILVMNPPSYQMTISPGASLNEEFTAQGSTTSPADCTFNGAAC